MPQIPFVGASYRERSSNLDAQACINLFPVLGESGTAKAVSALYGTPGTRPLVTGWRRPGARPAQPHRRQRRHRGQRRHVYRLSTFVLLTKIGSVDNLTTPVSIADNGTQAVIVTGAERLPGRPGRPTR
jgi:hypothetical protein